MARRIVLLVVLLALVGCSAPTPMVKEVARETTVVVPQTVVVTQEKVTIPQTVEAPQIVQATVIVTATPLPAATAAPKNSTPTAIPTLAPAVSADNAVNLRSGPGTGYAIVGVIKQGDGCSVQGRTEDRTWLEVRCGDQQASWVAASVVHVGVDLATVPVEKNIPPPPPTSTPAPPSIPTAVAQSAPATSSGGCPAGQAAYHFHHFLGGATVDVTFTHEGDAKKASLIMPPNSEQALCLDPGRWTYTIAAPGWTALNDQLQSVPGQTTQFPISGTCETTPLFKRDSGGVSIQIGTVTICTIQKPPA